MKVSQWITRALLSVTSAVALFIGAAFGLCWLICHGVQRATRED
ncbi:TPA: hypothetical protein ACITN2_004338 [Salmonella enterica subsp. enterica serovar Virchow]